MKVRAFVIISIWVISGSSAIAAHSVQKLLPNIQDRVRQCSVLPYVINANQVSVSHHLRSHCPEVKVLPRDAQVNRAKIKVAGHQFIATLIETEFTDGDFYDVQIQDLRTGDQLRFFNVPAFGDVLLGVLEGNTTGVESLQLESLNF